MTARRIDKRTYEGVIGEMVSTLSTVGLGSTEW